MIVLLWLSASLSLCASYFSRDYINGSLLEQSGPVASGLHHHNRSTFDQSRAYENVGVSSRESETSGLGGPMSLLDGGKDTASETGHDFSDIRDLFGVGPTAAASH